MAGNLGFQFRIALMLIAVIPTSAKPAVGESRQFNVTV